MNDDEILGNVSEALDQFNNSVITAADAVARIREAVAAETTDDGDETDDDETEETEATPA